MKMPAVQPSSNTKFIVDMLCRRQTETKVFPGAVFGKSRAYPVAVVRRHAMWLLRELTQLGASSTNWIGRQFKRDHTTVLHAIKVVERQRAEDPIYKAETDKLRETVRTMLGMRQAAQAEEGRLVQPEAQA